MAFIIKHNQEIKPQKKVAEKNNSKIEKKEVMHKDKISMVETILNDNPQPVVKKIKKDKGLIERTESSKTILTEDNKQLLVD